MTTVTARLACSTIAACACALVLTCGAAWARPDDHAATAAYIRAARRLLSSAASHLAASESAASRAAEQIRQHCPGRLAAAPAHHGALETELLGAVYAAAVAPDAAAERAYAHSLKRLSWSNARLTRLVATEAAQERARASLTVPAVCADARAWRASGFGAVPATTERFDRSFDAIAHAVEPQAAIRHDLRRYESTSERAELHRLATVEAHINEVLLGQWLTAASQARAWIGLTAPRS